MKKIVKIITIFLLIFLSIYSDEEKVEFRGVWIASVDNINWPSKPGLTDKEQKAEIIDILDEIKSLNMNAIIMQIRPTADRIYKKIGIEPWSKYLIGENGKPPKYDPLEFFIEEAHKRGIEFHAWFNPYRITLKPKEIIPENHVVLENPDWIVEYNERYYYDPGNPFARRFIENLIVEVVKNYDIDAIHMDDYFYPYPIKNKKGKKIPFDDKKSYKKYGKGMRLEDWRRKNTDDFVKNLNLKIKRVKPEIRYGISPFGVWRNKSSDPTGSDTKAGIENYDDLYADTRKWIKNGWIDYIVPQIYWDFKLKVAQYDILVDWWAKEVEGTKVDLYVGHGMYKIGTTKNWRNPNEIINQIKYNRAKENVKGSVFFGFDKIQDNTLKIRDNLKKKVYQERASLPHRKDMEKQVLKKNKN